MRPLRVIHAADCHLDAPSRSLAREVRERVGAVGANGRRAAGGAGRRPRRPTRCCWRATCSTATWCGYRPSCGCPRCSARPPTAGVTVIAVTGNHDPGGGAGPLDRIGWPTARFHLVRDRTPALDRAAPARRRAGRHRGRRRPRVATRARQPGRHVPHGRRRRAGDRPRPLPGARLRGRARPLRAVHHGRPDRARVRLLGARPRAHRGRRVERAAGLVLRLPAGPALRRDRRQGRARRRVRPRRPCDRVPPAGAGPLAGAGARRPLRDRRHARPRRALRAAVRRPRPRARRAAGPGLGAARSGCRAARRSTPSCAAPRPPTTSPSRCASGCRSSKSRSATRASRRPSTWPSTRASRTCSAPRSS